MRARLLPLRPKAEEENVLLFREKRGNALREYVEAKPNLDASVRGCKQRARKIEKLAGCYSENVGDGVAWTSCVRWNLARR